MANDSILIQSLFILGAYLSGSVCSAIIVCRFLGLPDPRQQGSNNPGTTNVLRIGGRKAAIITLLGDMLKGLVPVLLARILEMPPLIVVLTAAVAFLGHLYPVFFGFNGGKGVATLLGVLLGIHWMLGLTAVGTWLLIAGILRVSSVSALVMAALVPVYSWFFFHDWKLTLVLAGMSMLLCWRHRNNIRNLLGGKEGGIAAPGKVANTDTGMPEDADNETGRAHVSGKCPPS